MTNTLFLQSEVHDPYVLYKKQLSEHPVFADTENKLLAVYSYRLCREALASPVLQIPPVAMEGLDEYALAITGRLVRLSNMPGHVAARQAALQLMQRMKQVPVQDTMRHLLPAGSATAEIDWVDSVGRQLPVLSILQGFEVDGAAADFMTHHIGVLIKLMQPVKTGEGLAAINAIAKDIYCLLEKHILQKAFLTDAVDTIASTCSISTEEALALCISNITGLLIQSYDAGRGILSNVLLHLLRAGDLPARDTMGKVYLQQCVTETLRFDPPVHNTRRIAAEAMALGDYAIEKGQMILVVMAAANRDPQQFATPDQYNASRPNNAEHLTFGFGAHGCVANRFTTHITTEALWYLFRKYRHIQLSASAIAYEPAINVRLPQSVLISLEK